MTIEKANKAVKSAFIAALISATLTLAASIAAFYGYTLDGLLSPWMFLDAILIYALALGLYKKSRICSTLMLAYWVTVKTINFADQGTTQGLAVAMLFTFYFLMGCVGTFYYHKLKKQQALTEQTQSSVPEPSQQEPQQQPQEQQLEPVAANSWRTN